MLAVDFLYPQVFPVQDDLQQKLRAELVFKDLAHEVVIQQPEIPDTLQIFLMFVRKIQILFSLCFRHRVTCFHPFSYQEYHKNVLFSRQM